MIKVTGKKNSQDFTDEDLRKLMCDIDRRENELDADFWENAPDENPQDSEHAEPECKPNSPEDLGFVKDDTEAQSWN